MKRIDSIFLELIGYHILITFFSMMILNMFLNIDSQLILGLFFLLTLSTYLLSGYFLTNKMIKWYNYFGVALVGVLFWTVCYIKSPESTNYKQNNDSGLWLFYELYIMAKSPLYFIKFSHYDLEFDLIGKLIFPIIFSISQFIGGVFKMKRIKKEQ